MSKRQADCLIEKLSNFAGKSALGRMRVDIGDLEDICNWYIGFLNKTIDDEMTEDDLETALIEIETKFIDHAGFHFKSLKRDIRRVLNKIPEN